MNGEDYIMFDDSGWHGVATRGRTFESRPQSGALPGDVYRATRFDEHAYVASLPRLAPAAGDDWHFTPEYNRFADCFMAAFPELFESEVTHTFTDGVEHFVYRADGTIEMVTREEYEQRTGVTTPKKSRKKFGKFGR
jgi:hypothetical protein